MLASHAGSTHTGTRMPNPGLQKIVETGTFSWPWQTSRGLAILTGGSGGSGGGGAFCMEGLNLYGAGGGGGEVPSVKVGDTVREASGGAGGGGITNGVPQSGPDGRGCAFGAGTTSKGSTEQFEPVAESQRTFLSTCQQ